MKTVTDYPILNQVVVNISHKSLAEKESFFNNTIGKFIDEFIFQRGQNPPTGLEEDGVKNYALCFIYMTYVLL